MDAIASVQRLFMARISLRCAPRDCLALVLCSWFDNRVVPSGWLTMHGLRTAVLCCEARPRGLNVQVAGCVLTRGSKLAGWYCPRPTRGGDVTFIASAAGCNIIGCAASVYCPALHLSGGWAGGRCMLSVIGYDITKQYIYSCAQCAESAECN
jgi:hypothetical protein